MGRSHARPLSGQGDATLFSANVLAFFRVGLPRGCAGASVVARVGCAWGANGAKIAEVDACGKLRSAIIKTAV